MTDWPIPSKDSKSHDEVKAELFEKYPKLKAAYEVPDPEWDAEKARIDAEIAAKEALLNNLGPKPIKGDDAICPNCSIKHVTGTCVFR